VPVWTRALRAFAAIAVLPLWLPLWGQAASVSPQAVLLTDRRPSGSITVLNPNTAPIDIALGVRYGYVTSDSATGRTTVKFLTDSIPGNSATRLVRFAPARFRLPPGGSQIVRFVAVTPDNLPEGEYWGRVTVAAAAVTDDGLADATVRVSGSVNIEVQTVIPLFFRKGRLATALRGQVAGATRHDNVVQVQPHFERSGNGVSIGLARLDVLDSANTVLHSTTRQLAVYDRLDPPAERPASGLRSRRTARIFLRVCRSRSRRWC
jgi:P pilus assembly chaperone PapD